MIGLKIQKNENGTVFKVPFPAGISLPMNRRQTPDISLVSIKDDYSSGLSPRGKPKRKWLPAMVSCCGKIYCSYIYLFCLMFIYF